MLDMTVGQLKALIIAHNIDRLKDVFAQEDNEPGSASIGKVAEALRNFDPTYYTATRTIVAEIMKVPEAAFGRAAARSYKRGDQLRDPHRGTFVTPTRNTNSHNYGTSPLLVTAETRGVRPCGNAGNILPDARNNAIRASTPDEVAAWIRQVIDRLCGATVENDATLRQVLDLIVARAPADDEPASVKAAREQAMQVGCQTPAMQTLLAAIGREDLVTTAATAPGRVIELRRSGAVAGRCVLVLGYDPDTHFTTLNQAGDVVVQMWHAGWAFANRTTARTFLQGLVAKWAAALPKPEASAAAAPKKGKAPKVEKAAPKKSSRKKAATLAGAGS